jgi:hypothetical protein
MTDQQHRRVVRLLAAMTVSWVQSAERVALLAEEHARGDESAGEDAR